MKRLQFGWLIIVLGLCRGLSAASLVASLPLHAHGCDITLLENQGIPFLLEPETPFFSNLLQLHTEKYGDCFPGLNAADIAEKARAFVIQTGPHLITAKTRDRGQIKFDERNHQLLITYDGNVIVYLPISKEILFGKKNLGFVSGRHFVSELASRLRWGNAIEKIQPFTESSLLEHCANHAWEFGLNPNVEKDCRAYARKAYEFARSEGGRMLLLDFVDRNGCPMTAKFHLGSGELLIINAQDGRTRSFYRILPEFYPRYRVKNDFERFLSVMNFVNAGKKPS